MASPNYTLWRHAADKGEVRRATYVCGDQPVLIEEVVDTTRALLAVSDLDYVSLDAGAVADRDIWAAANQYSLSGTANRLVLVRDAHRIKNWNPLTDWIGNARRLPHNYLLLVSNQDDFPTVAQEGKKALAPHIEAIRAGRGRLVRCGMPNEADSIAWVRSRAPHISEDMASYLLQRVGADLIAAAGVCAKLKLFGGNPGPSTIDALCDPGPSESFVDCLIAQRREEALLVAQSLPDKERGRLFSLLDARLDLLAALYRATRAGLSYREVKDVPVFLIRKLSPHAKHYDPRRCAYRRHLLAVLEGRHRSGVRTGVLESLVAMW